MFCSSSSLKLADSMRCGDAGSCPCAPGWRTPAASQSGHSHAWSTTLWRNNCISYHINDCLHLSVFAPRSYCAAAELCQQTLEQEGYGGSGEINREGSSRFLESCGQAGCGAEIASTDPADMTDNSDGDDGGDADGDGSAAGAWQEGSGLEEAEDAPAGDAAAAAGCCWEDSMTPEAGGTTVSGCSELASQAQQVHGGSDATTEVEAHEFDLEAAFAAVAAATAAAAAAACAGVHICMVDDCDVDLAELKPYFRRSKVCPTHQSAPSVNLNGVACRYCQQCTRCHPVSEFDGTKR